MKKVSRDQVPPRWLFLTLILFSTWLWWIPAGTTYIENLGVFSRVLHYAGGLMPTIVTLFFLYRFNSRKERKDYWRRLIDFSRINIAWYAVIFLTIPLLTSLSIFLADVISHGEIAVITVSNILQNPISILSLAVFTLLFGPLPEEMAWRGYALDGLQLKWSALTSSFILGTVWTIWHLPLFLIDGSYQHGLGIGTISFWLYMIDKVPQSIYMTWIYNHNQRSWCNIVSVI